MTDNSVHPDFSAWLLERERDLQKARVDLLIIPIPIMESLLAYKQAHQAFVKTPRPTVQRSIYFTLSAEERLEVAKGNRVLDIAEEWKIYEALETAEHEARVNLEKLVLAWIEATP